MSEIAYLPWQRVAWDMTIPRLLIHAGRQVGKSVVVAAIARRTDIGNVGIFAANHHMAQALRRMAKDAPNARFMSADKEREALGPKVFATEYECHFSDSPLPPPKRGES